MLMPSSTQLIIASILALLVAGLARVLRHGPPERFSAYEYQGWSRALELLNEERERRVPGFMVWALRHSILYLNFLRPQVAFDSALDWSRYYLRKGRSKQEVAAWRETYYLLRIGFFVIVLFFLRPDGLITLLLIALTGDMLLNVLGSAFVWGRHAASPERSLLLALVNYAELTIVFAVAYRDCQCFSCPLLPREALYFSTATATTLGYVPEYLPRPRTDAALGLMGLQLVAFAMFSLVVIQAFLTRLYAARGEEQPPSSPN